jgi:hypothetical protein
MLWNEWTSSNKKKKEKYFDMVTNPNRFNTFNTQASAAQAQPPQPTSIPAYSASDDIAASVIPWGDRPFDFCGNAFPNYGCSSCPHL